MKIEGKMKIVWVTFVALMISTMSNAGVPPKITISGKYKKTEDGMVFLTTQEGAVVRLPASLTHRSEKPLTSDSMITLRVPIGEFFKLN